MLESIKNIALSNFLASGFDFDRSNSHQVFKFRTLNYFLAISSFFGALIGSLGLMGVMNIGEIQPIVNIAYAFFNIFLIFILRIDREWFRAIAWIQVLVSLLVFTVALITVVHDEFRLAWFYIAVYLAYMLLGERSGNFLAVFAIFIIVIIHTYFDLQLSNTAIQTAIFSIIVFSMLSRVYNRQIKSYERELENKNYDLAAVIKNLDYALEGAQEASQTKSLFLANMSHEIRTPMNGMLSLIQVLRTTKLDENQLEYLRSVDRAGEILMSLIDDLLDLSRIESGRLDVNIKTFKLWDFLEDVLLQAEHLFDEKKDVHFNVDVDEALPTYLIADDVRLKQVVINLINNAVKFTDHGEVDFNMSGNKKESGRFNLHVEVKDTGVGIPKDKIDSIFIPFQQLSSKRIYNKGVGLGLPICKKIIDALDGTIKIDSTVGLGSKFILDFDLSVAENSESSEKITKTTISLEPKTILLVEDDQISRLALNTWLKEHGHKVVIAENGKKAVDYLEENDVDVILMDVHMPEMDGVLATKLIKEKQLSRAPIIGMTASVMNDERKGYLEAGMDVLIEKPVKFDNLIRIVKDKLNK